MKKKNIIPENYLEKKPIRSPYINWTTDEEEMITLEVENRGIANKIAQKLFKKPKTTYVHLDEMGSFLWPLFNGRQSIISLGQKVQEHFGEKAAPLYERLAKYIQILESYNFIVFESREDS